MAGYRLRYKWFEAQLEYKILNPTREIHIPQAYVPNTSGLGGKGFFYGIAINFLVMKNFFLLALAAIAPKFMC